MADDVEDARCQPEVFGCAAPGYDECIVGRFVDFSEGRVQAEIVAALLAVGLFAFEIVNRGGDGVTGFFAGADGMLLLALANFLAAAASDYGLMLQGATNNRSSGLLE